LIGGQLNRIADGDSPRREPIGGHAPCTPPRVVPKSCSG